MTDREGGEGFDARKLLYELRGVPDGCDFCQRKLPHEQLEPEEGGDWVCHDCMWRWEIDENAALRARLAASQFACKYNHDYAQQMVAGLLQTIKAGLVDEALIDCAERFCARAAIVTLGLGAAP